MAAHNYGTLLRALKKGALAPVYYLYGAEDVLKEDAARAIVDRVIDPSLRDFNFDQRSASQLDAETLHVLCNTVPMMAEHRVVLVRDIEAWRKKTRARTAMVRYLEHPAPEAVVILVQGAGEETPDPELARHAYTVHLESLPPARAQRWITHHAARLDVQLTSEAAKHLLQSVGTDLSMLSAELQKFASLPQGTPVTAAVVGDLVGVQQGQTIYDWRDAVLGGDPGRAVGLLEPVLAQPGNSGVKLVSLLGTTLVGIGVTRGHYDRKVRGSALEAVALEALKRSRPVSLLPLAWTEEAHRWSAWAAIWPRPRLREALEAALVADQALKNTTVSNDRGILADLVMRLTVPYREAA